MASSGKFGTFKPNPKLVKLLNEGANNIQAQLAVTVCADLCQYRNWTDVELHYCPDQRQTYLLGKPTENAAITTVIPLNSSQNICFSKIRQFLHLGAASNSSLILALCEEDSLIVYYKFCKGIVKKIETNTEMDNEAH